MTCTKCNLDQPEEEFLFRHKAKGIRRHQCRKCQSVHKRNFYLKNKEYYIAKSKKSNARQKELIREYLNELKSVPCMDCKRVFPPCAMDFDHRDPSLKRKNVSKLEFYSFKSVEEEIAKCDIVCANCHRIRTHLSNT